MATAVTGVLKPALQPGPATRERYAVRLANCEADRLAAFRLRFQVFNLELNEGLESAYEDGYDRDEFDDVCQHLLVYEVSSDRVVGTYRLQSGSTAAANRGYYSEREFDFAPFEHLRNEVIELGRACVHRDHRSFEVLNLLWKGIATYAQSVGARYLIGCSSLTSQDTTVASAVYRKLSPYLVEPELRTAPTPEFAFQLAELSPDEPIEAIPPKLLRAYLAIGARICGAPAIDREFKTIDFLTLIDLTMLPAGVRLRYFGKE
jgi:putative hemolysin